MIEFLTVFSKITYVILIISSVTFGISIAVNILVCNTIKKINKETDFNFNKIENEDAKKIILTKIESANLKLDEYFKENKIIKKQKTKNRIRKFFKKKQVAVSLHTLSFKDILVELVKGVYEPFSNVNGKERGYLSFSEREIFNVLNSTIKRVENIFEASNVIWLKSIKISTFLQILKLKKAIDNNIFVAIALNLINFFMWFSRVFSPVSISKYFINTVSSQNLSTLFTYTIVNILGKELAVLYMQNRLENTKLEKIAKTA